MNSSSCIEIMSILARRSRVPVDKIDRNTRFVEDLKLDGDDAIDAILEVSKAFQIDISGFDGGAHFRSEPSLISLLRKSVAPKPAFTVGELVDAADRGSLSAKAR